MQILPGAILVKFAAKALRIFRKISKGFLKLVVFLTFLLTVCYILIKSRPFQNWAAQKAVAFLSQELQTKVKLQSVDFEFLNNLVLRGLYIEDKQGDTLGYFGALKVNFNYKILFNNQIQLAQIKRVDIEDASILFTLHKGQKDFNYEFLIDYFSPPGPSTGKHVPFKLFIKSLELKNVNFRYVIEDSAPAESSIFNEDHLDFKNINAVILPFKLVDDSLNFNIRHLSFIERSGLQVLDLYSKTTISGTEMEFKEMSVTTPNSSIGNYLKFSYNTYDDISDFITKVQWDGSIVDSKVHHKDLVYFSDEMNSLRFSSEIQNGQLSGTLEKLIGKNIELKINGINSFRGNFILNEVTETNKLVYEFDSRQLYLNPSSVQQILSIDLPEELLRIGSIKYKGDIKGSINDIKLKGLFESTVGKVSTDLALRFPEGQTEEYKGSFEVFALNTGKLMNMSGPGLINMSASVDGKGFTIQELNTKLQAQILNFTYDDYTYQNVVMDGVFEKKLFNGVFKIDDPNIRLALVGRFDLNNEMPYGDFKSQIDRVNLKTLGYGNININELSNIDIKFEGNDLDNMSIQTSLNNLILEKNDTLYRLGDIALSANGKEDYRVISLKSNIVDIDISGQYRLSYLNSISNNLLYNLFPEYYTNLKNKIEPVDLRFDISIANTDIFSALFLPDFHLSNFTSSGIYNSINQKLDVIAIAEKIKYQSYSFEELTLKSNKEPGERLALSTDVRRFFISDSLITDKLNLVADIGGNDINYRLNISDTSHDLSLKSGGNVTFTKSNIDFNFRNSALYIYTKPWFFNDSNHFTYSSGELNVENFNVSNGDQSINLAGKIDESSFNQLEVFFSNFELNELNPVLKKWQLQFSGKTNGVLGLTGPFGKPAINGNLDVGNMVFNSDTIGDISLTSLTPVGQSKMRIDGKIKNGLINDLRLAGTVDLMNDRDNLNLTLSLDSSSLKPFEVFTEGIFSGLEGFADARIKIKGDLENPQIDGKVNIDKGRFFMDYLGIPIYFEKVNITIDDKRIRLGTFTIYDKYGAKGYAGGSIYHTNFDDLKFNIFTRELTNFYCLNLREDQNELFSGVAFIDGDLQVTGPMDEILMKINAKTRPNTVISLPLSGATENTGPDYIEIVDLRADQIAKNISKISGILMDFNFNITEDAEIKLIFDAKFDDVIKATGKGNIRMELNTYGDFYMYGKYTISTGSYNFTALNNLVNKNLKVKPGGSITWNGPPFDALVDLVATSYVKANPTVILPTTTLNENIGNVEVECAIHMTEKLFEPNIQFGIDLPQDKQTTLFANSDLTSAINQIKADRDETNKQFINLMVFNAFAPLNSGANTATSSQALSSFQNSIGEFMTNQLNNWLSQIDPNWELGVDFQNSGNAESNQQIILNIRRKLYNDRIEISGTYGQAGNSSYDANVSYKIKKDGRMKLRAFSKQANDPINPNGTLINTSGLGLFYRKEINYFFPKWRKRRNEKKFQKRQAPK
ncbi:MAG: translocation/assembly module TamB domain-containing protein [Flavobacteriales bacterium]|nr:translocation/assembly module TamB domain-containing protein [Flavobacteriales bacterium]